MKVAVFSNGNTVIVVGLDKYDDPIDHDGTLFGPHSGRNIKEFDKDSFNPSEGQVIIVQARIHPRVT